jgi:hypothetical protein
MPTTDKIRVLAKWLKASPHWLDYGENVRLGLTGEASLPLSQVRELPLVFQRQHHHLGFGVGV